MSSDKSPQHQKYPQGLDWWCFYNKATANGQDPLSHKDHTGTPLSLELWSPPMRECRTPVSCKGLSKNEHKTRMSVWMEFGQRWSMWVLTQWMLWRHLLSSFNQGCPHLSQVMEYLGIPTAQLHEDPDSPDRNKCKQADLESELVTKHSRVDKSPKKSKTVCQARREGQT